MSTYMFTSLNDVWGFLTMGFGVGLIVPQFVRWYWWRFNGYGYAGGTIVGMLIAIMIRFSGLFTLTEIQMFFVTASVTFMACIVIALMTPPTDDDTLRLFYKKTRPFGFWGRIRDSIPDIDMVAVNRENRRDIMSTFIAVPWMLFMGITPMLFVTKQWEYFGYASTLLVVLSVFLYFNWFRHLSKEGME
jgi:solute:Na+ symporter, SSS family